MTKLLDMTGGKFVLRKPDGSVMLDTAERTPAEIDTAAVTLTIDWPIAPGEYIEWLPVSGKYRHHIPAHQTLSTQVVKALPIAGIVPQFYLTRWRITQTLRGKAGPYQMYPRPPRSWFGAVGSAWLENHGIYVFRAINLAVSGSNIVIEQRQLGVGYEIDDIIPNSTRSTYTVEIDLGWGIFDG